MANLDSAKKPAPQDWHVADIKASLEKAGWSLARLANHHQYCRSAAALALRTPWPRMERLIAEALGVEPKVIWPTRYDDQGNPKSGRGQRGLGRFKRKASRPASNDTPTYGRRNVETSGLV